VYDPSDVVSDGAEVDVWVKYVDAVKGVIGLTMVPPAGAVGFSGRVKVGEVNIGGRYEGVVARVTNYGAYVDIGAERHGFVHVSALWGRRPRETLEDLRLGRRIWVHVDEVDEVRSFVRLRARGKRGGEELSEHAEVGDAVEDLLDVGLGAEDGAPRAVPPVTEEIVLQRFGAELAGGDEEDEDEDEDEDGDEDGDEDYDEDEDDDDEYEMDFEHQVAARFQPPPEAAYGTLADYDDGGKDVDVDDDEDSEENNFGETWSDPTEHTARGVYL
jgi:predicted RNA-binding protein with RPS1 domain